MSASTTAFSPPAPLANDILVILVGTTSTVPTPPTGFAQLISGSAHGASFYVFTRVATGNEGQQTVTITFSAVSDFMMMYSEFPAGGGTAFNVISQGG